jgi:hypothetical protein
MTTDGWLDRSLLLRSSILATAFAGVAGFVGLGSIWHALLCLCVAVFFGVPLSLWWLATAARFLIGRWRRRPVDRGPLSIGIALTIVLVGVVASCVIGVWMHAWEIERTKTWCLANVPRIEEHRRRHARYPSTLDDVLPRSEMPRLVRNGDLHYGSDEDSYWFDLWTGMLSGEVWNSDRRIWSYYD